MSRVNNGEGEEGLDFLSRNTGGGPSGRNDPWKKNPKKVIRDEERL